MKVSVCVGASLDDGFVPPSDHLSTMTQHHNTTPQPQNNTAQQHNVENKGCVKSYRVFVLLLGVVVS